jgi:nucleotide-binding universal stress UspA family protein
MVAIWTGQHDEAVRARIAQLEELSSELPPPCRECKPLVSEGEPATEILRAIEHEKIDLVVIGFKRKHVLAEVILGSTSEAVVSHAVCSVLLVPERAAR